MSDLVKELHALAGVTRLLSGGRSEDADTLDRAAAEIERLGGVADTHYNNTVNLTYDVEQLTIDRDALRDALRAYLKDHTPERCADDPCLCDLCHTTRALLAQESDDA